MQTLKKVGIFAHVQFLYMNGCKVVAEVSMASVNFPSLHKTLRVKLKEGFYTDKDKLKNLEIMPGGWIFSNKGVSPENLHDKVKQIYDEILQVEKNKLVLVTDIDQAQFLKTCKVLVSVIDDMPETIDLIYSNSYYKPPKRNHKCRYKHIYCSQTESWIKARYIQNLLKTKKKK